MTAPLPVNKGAMTVLTKKLYEELLVLDTGPSTAEVNKSSKADKTISEGKHQGTGDTPAQTKKTRLSSDAEEEERPPVPESTPKKKRSKNEETA
jgi:hypothetical protein